MYLSRALIQTMEEPRCLDAAAVGKTMTINDLYLLCGYSIASAYPECGSWGKESVSTESSPDLI